MTLPLPTPGDVGWADELNAAVAAKAEQTALDALSTTVDGKADTSALDAKANQSDVDTALAGKADLGSDGLVLPSQLPPSTGGAPTLAELPTYDPSEFVRDPDANDLGTWTLGPFTIAGTIAPAPGSASSKVFRATGNSSFQQMQQATFPVTPGDSFLFDYYVRHQSTAATAGYVGAGVLFQDASGATVSTSTDNIDAATAFAGGNWMHVNRVVAVPDGAAQAEVFVRLNGSVDAGIFDFSVIRLRKILDSGLLSTSASGSTVSVDAYDVSPDNTAAANDAAMAALIADHPSGKWTFPEVGTYSFSQPFPIAHGNITLEGAGQGTILSFTDSFYDGSSLPSGTTHLSGFTFRDLRMTATTRSLIDLGNGTGLINVIFDNCMVEANGAGISIVSATANSVNLFGWQFNKCFLSRDAASTLPAIRVSSTSNGINNWTFRDCTAHSHKAENVFFYFGHTSGANPFVGLEWNGIIGEQNPNGLVNIFDVESPVFINVQDWDCVSYNADLIRTDNCNRVYASNVGTTSLATFASGKYTVRATNGTGHALDRIYNGQGTQGTVATS